MMGSAFIAFSGLLTIIFFLIWFLLQYVIFLKSKRIKKLYSLNRSTFEKENEKLNHKRMLMKKTMKWGIIILLVMWIISLATLLFVEITIPKEWENIIDVIN